MLENTMGGAAYLKAELLLLKVCSATAHLFVGKTRGWLRGKGVENMESWGPILPMPALEEMRGHGSDQTLSMAVERLCAFAYHENIGQHLVA